MRARHAQYARFEPAATRLYTRVLVHGYACSERVSNARSHARFRVRDAFCAQFRKKFQKSFVMSFRLARLSRMNRKRRKFNTFTQSVV